MQYQGICFLACFAVFWIVTDELPTEALDLSKISTPLDLGQVRNETSFDHLNITNGAFAPKDSAISEISQKTGSSGVNDSRMLRVTTTESPNVGVGRWWLVSVTPRFFNNYPGHLGVPTWYEIYPNNKGPNGKKAGRAVSGSPWSLKVYLQWSDLVLQAFSVGFLLFIF